MSSALQSITRELVTGLSDNHLQGLVQAGVDELAKRSLPLPSAIGQSALNVIEAGPHTTLADGRLIVAHSEHSVLVDGHTANIPSYPFQLLSLLAIHTDTVVSRSQMQEHIWKNHIDVSTKRGSLALMQIISRLRGSLGREDLGHKDTGVIRNRYGQGWVAFTSIR